MVTPVTLRSRMLATLRFWQEYGRSTPMSQAEQDARYALLGMFYSGLWASDPRWTMLPTDVADWSQCQSLEIF